MRSNPLKPHQTAIVAAGLLSVVLWAIPSLHWVMLPMQYLNTHLHELYHAIAAVGTGGVAQAIYVHANGSGETPVGGGFLPLIAAAGYVGAALLGAVVMLSSRTERSSANTLFVLAGALTVSLVVWVLRSGEIFGIASAIAWIAVLIVAGRYAKGGTLLFVAQFIGLQQCLNAVQSLYTLLQLSAFTEVHSDAKLMEQATGGVVPAIVWSIAWCFFSLVMLGLGLRRAWSRPSPAKTKA